MKKRLLMLAFSLSIMFVFLVSLSIPSNAAGKQPVDTAIANILNNQLSDGDISLLENVEFYHESLEGIDIQGKPVVVWYGFRLDWKNCNLSLNELLNLDSLGTLNYYFVLGESDLELQEYAITDYEQGTTQIGLALASVDLGYPFLDDIRKATVNMEIMGENRIVSNIYTFMTSSGGCTEAASYYVTNSGTFVRYYEFVPNTSVWLKESDFQKYGSEYKKFVDDNSTKNGKDVISFVEYLKTNYGIGEENNINQTPNDAEDVFCWYIPVIASIVAVLIMGALVFLYIKKKNYGDRGRFETTEK